MFSGDYSLIYILFIALNLIPIKRFIILNTIMKKWALILSLLSILTAFKIEVQGIQSAPVLTARVPAYIGAGYHALKGNPYTNRIDQGFRSPIFSFTYSKGQTTPDGQYFIPDFTQATLNFSCDINSKIKSFSGTENYQKQLSNIASFDTRYDATVMNARFGFSSAFQSLINNVISKKLTSTQSNAECLVYNVEMPIYSNQIELSSDFTQGVKISFANNDWQTFLQHFGSHYTTSVSFGGRYFLQHTYTEQSLSLFKSLKIDLSMVSQFQYDKTANITLTDDLKRYANQTNVVNSKVESYSLATVGGLPPASGNQKDWVSTVKANLAPITYKLTAITVLFNYIQGLDAPKAIKSFEIFFNEYCQRNTCPEITPDRPDPRPLSPVFSKGTQIAGDTKSALRYDTNDDKITVGMRISKIQMGFSANFETIKLTISDGTIQHVLPDVGTTPINRQYIVPTNDELKCIRFGVHAGTAGRIRFSTVQFTTKGGVQSEVFKGNTTATDYKIACIQSSQDHIVGMYGSWNGQGHTFDSIGLNLMKEVIPEQFIEKNIFD